MSAMCSFSDVVSQLEMIKLFHEYASQHDSVSILPMVLMF